MTNKDRFSNWAETRILMNITFWWFVKGEETECRLHNRTYNEALNIAKSFGYKEPKWFKPWTWQNGVVTVG